MSNHNSKKKKVDHNVLWRFWDIVLAITWGIQKHLQDYKTKEKELRKKNRKRVIHLEKEYNL